MPESAMQQPSPLTFEEFFRREYVAMVTLAAAITSSRSDGEDLAQVALARAHEDWDRVSR